MPSSLAGRSMTHAKQQLATPSHNHATPLYFVNAFRLSCG